MGKIHFINGQLQNPNPRMLKKVWLIVGAAWAFFSAFGQSPREQWVDSTFNTLAAHEKMGQLFVLRAAAPTNESEFNELAEKIKRFHPGGIELVSVPTQDLKIFVTRLMAISKVPLLIGVDENMELARADSLQTFPSHLNLAALRDTTLIDTVYQLAASWLAHQGVDYTTGLSVNLLHTSSQNAPSQNKIGDVPEQIQHRLARWTDALAGHNLFAVPEFETSDSILAMTKTDTARLNDLSPYFFLAMPQTRIVRTTGFQFQIRTENQLMPAARSGAFIKSVVRGQLKFQGLLQYVGNSSEDYISIFSAGNELIATDDIEARQLNGLTRILRKNKILKAQLDFAAKRLLGLKYDLRRKPASNREPWQWQQPEKRALFQAVFQDGITVVKNEKQWLPVRNLDFQKLALVNIGQPPSHDFEKLVRMHAPMPVVNIKQLPDTTHVRAQIGSANGLIVSVFDGGMSPTVVPWLHDVARDKNVAVCHFDGVAHLNRWAEFNALLAGYTAGPETQRASAQNLFGVQPGVGRLPISLPAHMEPTATIQTLPRFELAEPEAAGMDHHTLARIEPIVREAISNGATPGAQIVVARKGKVVYQKSFGTLTYGTSDPVTDSTLYDLASVTKVSATLQAVMFLHEKKLIDLNKKVSCYLPELKGTNKEDMILQDVLTHQAGLWPFLPFWASTMKDSVWLVDYYQGTASPDYPWPVSENLFARQSMKDSLWRWIIQSKVREKRARTPYDYRYSDMGFYMLQHLAEKLLNQPIEDFLSQNLYEPLGATTLGYLPRTRYSATRIAPTEQDKLFRKSLLVGYVHDQGAAMHGGVAGHAGLFGTALDLAKLGQLWLNKGTYGDTRFFAPETVDLFANRQFESSRRGLGWDKPVLNDWNSPTAVAASPYTFGHTGFTGTCVWVDPAFDLVYVFLSNRVHPDMTNNKLLNLNIRPRIQEVIYQSMFNYSLYHPTARN
jgi:CubicO group peptidase (beta-lactamase class C family)/beta-glucosidase-like glycosyl hydrolase